MKGVLIKMSATLLRDGAALRAGSGSARPPKSPVRATPAGAATGGGPCQTQILTGYEPTKRA
jgi:hypothetical protein